jgi:hypothetical protein
MGNCIKCGKETKNAHVYYSAEVANYEEEKWRNYEGIHTKTTIEYADFEKCSDYVCTQCCLKTYYCAWLGAAIFFVAGGIAASIPLILSAANPENLDMKDAAGPMIMCIFIAALCAAYCFVGFAKTNRRIKADNINELSDKEKRNDYCVKQHQRDVANGEICNFHALPIIQKDHFKRKTPRVCFSPESYRDLKKQSKK